MKTLKSALTAIRGAVQYLNDFTRITPSERRTPEWHEAMRQLQIASLAVERLSIRVPSVVFVSGHLDISDGEFVQHYQSKLVGYIEAGAHFVVGDAMGTDMLTQRFLRAKNVSSVVVFHMFDSPRNNLGFATQGGFGSDAERDLAMTQMSDVDLAWVRPGREKSGTAMNIARRTSLIPSEP